MRVGPADKGTVEQAVLQRCKEKEDARNAHFQDLVDKDTEIRSSLAASVEARTASADRTSRAFELLGMAMLAKSLGPEAMPLIREHFAAAPRPDSLRLRPPHHPFLDLIASMMSNRKERLCNKSAVVFRKLYVSDVDLDFQT